MSIGESISNLEFRSSSDRSVFGGIELAYGNYYDGSSTRGEIELSGDHPDSFSWMVKSNRLLPGCPRRILKW